MHVVYTLADAVEPGAVRYVGVAAANTTLPLALRVRLNGHLSATKNAERQSPVVRWVRALRAAGRRPVIEPIGLDESGLGIQRVSSVARLERFWIRALLRDGHRLLNVQHTGKGWREHRSTPATIATLDTEG